MHEPRNLNAIVGRRTMAEDDWEPIDDQFVFGMSLDTAELTPWVNWDFALSFAWDDAERTVAGVESDFEAFTWEASVGILKYLFEDAKISPFIGFGGALLLVDADIESGPNAFDGDESELGVYARTGLVWRFLEEGYIGFDVRWLDSGEIDLGGLEVDLDYLQVSMLFGYSL